MGQFAPLDLEFPSGSFAVMTGPPGSGKSKILRAIAGLERVSSGEIRLGDKCINELAAKDRDLAMVFANDSLYPQMTVRENIAFGLKRRRFGATEIKKRIEEAAAILSIAELLERKPGALSLLEKQRAAIVRAVVRQPKVFLFDSALVHLGEEGREGLRKEIVMLQARLRVTTIFATEDVGEAMSMAEMIAIFDRGVLQGVGTSRALYEKPENIFVAKFLSRPPMNLIRGELRADRGGLRFHEAGSGTIEFEVPKEKRIEVAASAPILFGVRPEDIEPGDSVRMAEPHSYGQFRAIAESILPCGGETDIYFNTGAHTGLCRSSGWLDRDQAGRRMEFVVNLEKAHFFDENSGKRIV